MGSNYFNNMALAGEKSEWLKDIDKVRDPADWLLALLTHWCLMSLAIWMVYADRIMPPLLEVLCSRLACTVIKQVAVYC